VAHQHDHDEHEHEEHAHDHDHDGHEPDAAEVEREVRRRHALAQIRQYGDPALRMRAQEAGEVDDELRRLAARMIELMHDAQGIGLAANQVGIVRRFFVCTLDGEDLAIVDPVISRAGRSTEVDDEGCLSLGPVRVPVERPTEVTLEGKGLDGEPLRLELEGIDARVVQHELDHLDGTLIVDRTDAESRREALRALRPRLVLS
jgi:peptide deformylase